MIQPRVSSDTPSRCALTAVAPTVRFNAFEILATPAFFFASDFNSRTSDAVHARLTVFFFLAISAPYFRGALVSHQQDLATQRNFLAHQTCARIETNLSMCPWP